MRGIPNLSVLKTILSETSLKERKEKQLDACATMFHDVAVSFGSLGGRDISR